MARKAGNMAQAIVVAAPTNVISLEQAQLVRDYAELTALTKRAKTLEAKCRPVAKRLAGEGLRVIEGLEGVLVITDKQGANRLRAELVEAIIGPEQLEACKRRDAGYQEIAFKPRTV